MNTDISNKLADCGGLFCIPVNLPLKYRFSAPFCRNTRTGAQAAVWPGRAAEKCSTANSKIHESPKAPV